MGASAVLELAKKAIDMFELTDLEKETTVNVGVVHGGRLANVMAEDASAKLDIRLKRRKNMNVYKKNCRRSARIIMMRGQRPALRARHLAIRDGGADIFLDWLCSQTKVLSVLPRAHISE